MRHEQQLPFSLSRASRRSKESTHDPFAQESDWNAPHNESVREADPFSREAPLAAAASLPRQASLQGSGSRSTPTNPLLSPQGSGNASFDAGVPQTTPPTFYHGPIGYGVAPAAVRSRPAREGVGTAGDTVFVNDPYDVFNRPHTASSVLLSNLEETLGVPEDPAVPRKAYVDSVVYDLADSLGAPRRRDATDAQQGKQRGRTGVDLTFEDDSLTGCARAGIFFKNVWRTLKMWRLFLKLSCIDVRRRRCAYCLGLFSVFIVVLVCVVMLSVLSALPVVFLLLAEANRGMIDLQLAPGGQMSGAASLNYTMLEELFPPHGATVSQSYHAPRIQLSTAFMNTLDSCVEGTTMESLWYINNSATSGNESMCTGSWCINTRCVRPVPMPAIVFDQARERRMRLGDNDDFPAVKKNHVVLSRRAAFLLNGVRTGDEVFLYTTLGAVLAAAFPSNATPSARFTILPLTVQSVVEAAPTKFPEFSETYALLSYEHFTELVGENVHPSLRDSVGAVVRNTSTDECASYVNFNLPPGLERNRIYQSSSYNKIRENVMEWASPIITLTGFTQLSVATPITTQLWRTRMFSVFVGLIMSIIILALAFLSIMLIYALLTVGIDTRTYELGIQRMVGFTRENLVASVLCNAYFFTIPAWLVGIAAGQAVYLLVRFVFFQIAAVYLPIGISGSSIGWATLAGLLIPLVASIFPIWGLVTLPLPEALDSAHGRSSGVVYTIQRNDHTRINGAMLGLGFVFALAGFLLYYLFPMSIINSNLPMMFYIFFFVLIAMLAGLVLLASNFQRVVETVLLYVLLFWETKPVFRMAGKSLAAHRQRNRKTTLMYSLALAFVIFITVAFDIQLTSFNYDTYRDYGSDVVLSLQNGSLLEYAALKSFVDQTLVHDGTVTGLTYTPNTLKDSWSNDHLFRGNVLGSAGRYRTAGNELRPVPPNYYEVLDDRFLKVTRRVDSAERFSLSGVLYTPAADNALLLSTSAYNYLSMDPLGEGLAVLTDTWSVNRADGVVRYQRYAVTSLGSLEATPVLSASNFPSSFGSMIASVPTAVRLMGMDFGSARRLSVRRVHLRVPKKSDFGRVVDSLLEWDPDQVRWITTTVEATESMDTASTILNLFLIFTEIMILVICFFSLMSSMTSNVMDSSKEIAVLLCMGMTHFQLYRVYIWEAFLLVVSSGLLGLLVGVVVAYTMQSQNVLFTQLPLPFTFPYIQLCIVVGVGLLSALAASISPVSYLLHMPSITHILRRTIH